MINPVVLLQLNYYELERITPETITQAAARLFEAAGPEGAMYQGRAVGQEEARAAIALLQEPGQLAFYFELCKYPGLSRFLEGGAAEAIEKEALQAEILADRVAPIAEPLYNQQFEAALDGGKTGALEALGQVLSGGGAGFQKIVFQGAASLIERKAGELKSLAEGLEGPNAETLAQPLRGLQQFRKDYPVQVFNALPTYFDEQREAMARSMGRMVRALVEKDNGLALAIARYARQLRVGEDYTGRLDKVITFLENKARQARADQAARSSRGWMAGAGIGVLALLLVALGFGLRSVYNTVVDFLYEPSLFGDTRELEEAGIDQEELALLREAMKDGKGISREQLEEALRRQGNRTEVVEYDLTQMPWPERGAAADTELSGEAVPGSAPLSVCFPSRPAKGKTSHQLTIVGDDVYDALVFFFNGRTYVQQAYIPARSKYELKGTFDDTQVISTMIVFGQEWSPSGKSPCGTPGYFTQNVHYSGFAGYAMEPPYPDLRSDLVARLKKQRLVVSRELEEQAFFDLLEQYR
ncbi:MAG: hypothetical protein KDC66_04640 [Phaeodactylibacter sp.]|nr:hypothetical protein [Phaeodactylibacter sp.]MCB9276291.1 hypothetical protein [Lewinellaceae bacterium]